MQPVQDTPDFVPPLPQPVLSPLHRLELDEMMRRVHQAMAAVFGTRADARAVAAPDTSLNAELLARGTGGSMELVLGEGIPGRLDRKRTHDIAGYVRDLLEAVVSFDDIAAGYNAAARGRDPGLFLKADAADGADTLREAMRPEDGMDETANTLRPRMRALADEPDLVEMRKRLAEAMRKFERAADYISRMARPGDKVNAAAQALQSAMVQVKAVVAEFVAPKVEALPSLDVEPPNAVPGTMVARFADTMRDLTHSLEYGEPRTNEPLRDEERLAPTPPALRR